MQLRALNRKQLGLGLDASDDNTGRLCEVSFAAPQSFRLEAIPLIMEDNTKPQSSFFAVMVFRPQHGNIAAVVLAMLRASCTGAPCGVAMDRALFVCFLCCREPYALSACLSLASRCSRGTLIESMMHCMGVVSVLTMLPGNVLRRERGPTFLSSKAILLVKLVVSSRQDLGRPRR